MDFSEDNKLVNLGRKYKKKAIDWNCRYDGQLMFEPESIITIIGKFGYLFLGYFVKKNLNLGWGGFILSTIVIYVIFLLVKRILWKVYEKKANSIWKSLSAKYMVLRNDYIENKATEIGCTSVNKESTNIKEKEWDLPCESGYIKGNWCSKTYIHSMADNYGDIVIMGETTVANNDIWKLDAEYQAKGYSMLDVGVSDFNKRFRVYTKDPVKARTYFSATMIQDYLNKGMGLDYTVYGNNLFFEFQGVSISPEFNFNDDSIEHYFYEVDHYFKDMLKLKADAQSNENFMFK